MSAPVHAEALDRHVELLERIVRGEPLTDLLERIAGAAEAAGGDGATAIVFAPDATGRYQRPIAGAARHAALRARLDPLPAELLGDGRIRFADEPTWAGLREVPLALGLGACWSLPVRAGADDPPGALALLTPDGVDDGAARTLALLARMAALAIERDRSARVFREQTAELERRVEQRTASLTETIAALEGFSYSVSHDVRAPLRAMKGYAEALIQDHGARLDDEARGWLERIAKNATRLDVLVRDVLAYSRLANGAVALEAIDLDAFVRDFVDHSPHLQPPGLLVTVAGKLLPVLAHEACLAQALGNLLSNVAKFCRPGVPAEARISSEACGPMVRVTVADRGIGIDAAHFDRIFQIFGRIHPESAYEGTGIGLSVVKKAVERMGGGVGVDSQPGEGSRFWFTLKRV